MNKYLTPGADGISPVARCCIADRFHAGARQKPGDTYLQDGRPADDEKAYYEEIGRQWATALSEFESGATPTEDHLAAIACDAILLLQLRAAKEAI